MVPEVIAGGDASAWDGPQLVRADRAGNVFFFRADTLQIYPLTLKGALGDPSRLEVVGDAPQLVRDAVLAPQGDRWLLSADQGLRVFEDGKEKALPALEWRPSGIGFLRDEPVVSLLPLAVAWDRVHRERKGQIPRLMTFDGDRWNVLAEYTDLSAVGIGDLRPDINGAIAGYATFLTSDKEGRLWVARQYAYDVEQLTSTGKRRLQIVVDGAKVTEPKEAAKSPHQPAGLHAFRAHAALFDLVEGRDHRTYFLVAAGSGGGGLVLDRYDPVTEELERVPLALQLPGRVTLASGKHGLYFAAWNGRGGRWMLSWDALDLATWKPVPKAEISPGPKDVAPG